jgi:hypothetical protein
MRQNYAMKLIPDNPAAWDRNVTCCTDFLEGKGVEFVPDQYGGQEG